MPITKWPAVGSMVAALLLGQGTPGNVHAQSAPQTLVIGVDHADPTNQRPDQGRVFEYTDFFSRDVTVHKGDTLDFRFAPGSFHVVGLATTEPTARAAYPVVLLDIAEHVAPGTGLPKIQLGPSNGPIMGGSIFGGGRIGGPIDPPLCGIAAMAQSACTFSGGTDVESSGGIATVDPQSGAPVAVDWMMQISAPEGDYDYFCYIHPGMTGKLHIVTRGEPTSRQSDIDSTSAQQFQKDQALALQAEQQYDVDGNTTDGTTVTHHISVGVAAADNRVAIDEMLPRRVSFSQGDQVEFKWRDAHNVHTVGIAQAETQLPPPFLFDCGTTVMAPPNPRGTGGGFCFEQGDTLPETIGDPGNALSGATLKNTQQIVNSGLLAGTGYSIQPSTQTWSIRTDKNTLSGVYQYFCSVHDFMNGSLVIGQ